MRPSLRRAILALPAALLTAAACFQGDVPTEQVGGTEYGLLFSIPTPVRLPTASFRTRAVTGQPTTLDSLVVTLTNLEPLAGRAAYRFYAVGAGAGDTVPVSAVLTTIRTDSAATDSATVRTTRTTTTSPEATTFLRGAGNGDTVIARFAGAQFGGTARAFLVVTIQADSTAPAFTASTAQPLWLRYRAATSPFTALVATGTSQFGNFDLASPRFYTANGRGRSAFWDRYADGRLLYSAIFENLTQPPRGYYYQAWFRDTRTRRAVPLGDLTDPAGQPLRDADQLAIGGTVAQLPAARVRTDEATVGAPLVTFDGVHLTLEPKLGEAAVHSLTTVLLGTIGDTLALRGLGAIEVTVTRGGTPAANAAVTVVPVGGAAPVGTPRPAVTDAQGRVLITGIPAGEADLLVRPASGTAPATPPRVTVIRRDTTAAAVTLP